MRYPYIPIRTLMTKPGFGEDAATGTLMHRWWEGKNVQLLWKPPIWTFLMELSTYLAKTRHPTPRYLFKKNENLCWHRYLYENVYKQVLFIITKNGKQCQSPSSGEGSHKTWYSHTTESYTAIKKQEHLSAQ